LSETQKELKRKAVIVGSNGQDGRHLSDLLKQKNYDVQKVSRGDIDITSAASVRRLIDDCSPDEVYLLAAYHYSAESCFEPDDQLFEKSQAIHATATVHFLEAIACQLPKARLFFAASSHIFPDSGQRLIDECSVPDPGSVYAITKYAGVLACRYYRQQRGVLVSCGILFNHESSLRPPHFLSRKIAIGVANIVSGMTHTLEIGDLDAVVDWGYAPDYVDAMWRILQHDQPDDYVIATGVPNTVRDFVQIAFSSVGLDYRDHVKMRPGLLTKKIETRLGDSGLLRRQTGWAPMVSFNEMVQRMVFHEIASQSVESNRNP
jgi:GDPmannose 4,6-dehydratase